MKQLLLLITFLTLMAGSSPASRVRRGWYNYVQPDGTTISLEQRGDAWFHYYMTRDGVPVVIDETKDMFCYATMEANEVRSTGVMAHEKGQRQPAETASLAARSTLALIREKGPAIAAARRAAARSGVLPSTVGTLNPDTVYQVPVFLLEYSDSAFALPHAHAYYDSLFNCPGYNLGQGPGCVADYFRDQSGGRLNLHFDIFGPVKINVGYKYPSQVTLNAVMRQELQAAADTIDFSRYDWYGTGSVSQVLFVTSAFGRNSSPYGVSPHTARFRDDLVVDGLTIDCYSVTSDQWMPEHPGQLLLSGIGTICHEFSHCLGLPDFYPVSGSETALSICDEWDVMDGGNFTNWGWCPPNFSMHEKMLLGWGSPTELTDTLSVRNLESVTNGGTCYQLTNDGHANEYYLLENRQWDGWDSCLPGRGLIIWHVDYQPAAWSNNIVNSTRGHHRYEMMHASNMDYLVWDAVIDKNQEYALPNKVHSYYLSTSAYPFASDTDINRELTDTSVPAATVFNLNKTTNTHFMSKPITGIYQHDDGTMSFDFLGGTLIPAAIQSPTRPRAVAPPRYYTLSGQRLAAPLIGQPCLVQENGSVRKVFCKSSFNR